MSEIDLIFQSKGKAKDISPPSPLTQPKKKSSKKRKHKNEKTEPEATPASSKRPLPVTVLDSSEQILSSSKRRKTVSKKETDPSDPQSDKKDTTGLASFKDSRGTSDRRKTEEGWSIYKEDELGINQSGGDTPLCPFDCECCF